MAGLGCWRHGRRVVDEKRWSWRPVGMCCHVPVSLCRKKARRKKKKKEKKRKEGQQGEVEDNKHAPKRGDR